MEKIFGKGWTEWEILKNSKPLYPGHLFPKYLLWGYSNEADPEWAEKEIETAANSGINAWMIDWYWHSGTMFCHEQLEDGFLKARKTVLVRRCKEILGRMKPRLVRSSSARKDGEPFAASGVCVERSDKNRRAAFDAAPGSEN
jgi:hypothetical protein